MLEVQVDMVAVFADAAALVDFHGHGAADDVTRGQVLRVRRVAFHEALAVRIGQVAALAAHALGDQHPGAVNTGGMELHEFHVLQR